MNANCSKLWHRFVAQAGLNLEGLNRITLNLVRYSKGVEQPYSASLTS